MTLSSLINHSTRYLDFYIIVIQVEMLTVMEEMSDFTEYRAKHNHRKR